MITCMIFLDPVQWRPRSFVLTHKNPLYVKLKTRHCPCRLLFNWNFSPHYGQQVVPLSFGKRINDAWMRKFFYDYCYYSVGVVVAAKKSWFHLGLPQGSWLAYYCPPWLSTLSCFLPLLGVSEGGMGGMAPPVLDRSINHIPPGGGRLCPPHYYCPHPL